MQHRRKQSMLPREAKKRDFVTSEKKIEQVAMGGKIKVREKTGAGI